VERQLGDFNTGIDFVQTAAELERRRENFSKELDFVIADVVKNYHISCDLLFTVDNFFKLESFRVFVKFICSFCYL
jgi:hypothetical protein